MEWPYTVTLLSRHMCGRRFTTRSTLIIGIMSPATISGLHVVPLALFGSEPLKWSSTSETQVPLQVPSTAFAPCSGGGVAVSKTICTKTVSSRLLEPLVLCLRHSGAGSDPLPHSGSPLALGLTSLAPLFHTPQGQSCRNYSRS